jgi:hypothetical protein
MTNQERGQDLADKLHAVEGALKLVLPSITNTAGAAELTKSVRKLHNAMLGHATAMADALCLDVVVFSAGGDKRPE